MVASATGAAEVDELIVNFTTNGFRPALMYVQETIGLGTILGLKTQKITNG